MSEAVQKEWSVSEAVVSEAVKSEAAVREWLMLESDVERRVGKWYGEELQVGMSDWREV